MLELTKRAEALLKKSSTPYTTPPSTVYRVIELYERIPTPHCIVPPPPPARKGQN